MKHQNPFTRIMSPLLMGCIIWACNQMPSDETSTPSQNNEKRTIPDMHAFQSDLQPHTVGDTPPTFAIPMRSGDGRVIGYFFSTRTGDVCELRQDDDGHHQSP